MDTNKLLVIGIDGAPYPLIKQWVDEGYLPNIAKLIQRGGFGVLRSTIPVHSPTAWATFITGLNPGKHGVFDFVKRDKHNYKLNIVRRNDIPGASIWKLLSEQGLNVGVMNVPMTYPPEKVNGFLLSGLGTPDYSTYSFPPELTKELNSNGYRVNKKFFFDNKRQDEWLNDIHLITKKRGETAIELMKKRPWDFFMVVFRNSDEICHFFWHHMDKTHPKHDPSAPARYKTAIRDLYVLIDKQIGKVLEAAGNDTNILVVSDHGAGPLYKDVFLNEWLIQKGWLKLKNIPTAQSQRTSLIRKLGITRKNISDLLTRLNLHRVEVVIKSILGERINILPRDERPEFINAIDWSKTKAYSFGYYGQVFINLKGREPEGIVEPGVEYQALRDEIKRSMYEIVDPEDNAKIVDKVYKKEDLYSGDYLHEAPDLLAIMRDLTYITRKGYEFASERNVLFRDPYTNETGSHRIEGILIGAGPDIECQKQVMPDYDIQDVTPTILSLKNSPIPNYMDGHVIKELLSKRFLADFPPFYVEREIDVPKTDKDDRDDDEDREITERLKKLGYLG